MLRIVTNLFWLLAQTVQNLSLNPPRSGRSPFATPLVAPACACGCAMMMNGFQEFAPGEGRVVLL